MCQPKELIENFIIEVKKKYPIYSFGYTINLEGTFRIWHTNPDENTDIEFLTYLSVLSYDMITHKGFDDYYITFSPEKYDSVMAIEYLKTMYACISKVDTPIVKIVKPISIVFLQRLDEESLRPIEDRRYKQKDTKSYNLAA